MFFAGMPVFNLDAMETTSKDEDMGAALTEGVQVASG
jgi:hypothetical protein